MGDAQIGIGDKVRWVAPGGDTLSGWVESIGRYRNYATVRYPDPQGFHPVGLTAYVPVPALTRCEDKWTETEKQGHE